MNTLHRDLLEKIIRAHVNRQASSTLDIGSKNRRYDHLLDNKSVALDIIPNPKQKIEFGDVTKLDYDGAFEQVFCFEVLEYLDYPDIVAALHNLIKSVKPGGRILLSLPYNVRQHGDLTRFSIQGMKNVLQSINNIQSYKIINFGNHTTVSLDCALYHCKRLYSEGNILLAKICFWKLKIKKFFLVLLRKCSTTDDFYSGIFVIINR